MMEALSRLDQFVDEFRDANTVRPTHLKITKATAEVMWKELKPAYADCLYPPRHLSELVMDRYGMSLEIT